MNWFERHLNWSWILALAAYYPVYLFFCLLVGFVFFDASTSDATIESVCYFLLFVVSIALLVLAGWVLSKKGQSLAWLFLLLLPFIGIVVILALDNKNIIKMNIQEQLSVKATQNAASIVGVNYCLTCGRAISPRAIYCVGCGGNVEDEPFDYKLDKCPYCGNATVDEWIFKRSDNEIEKQKRGYSYLWQSKCAKCGKHWYWKETDDKPTIINVELPQQTQDNISIKQVIEHETRDEFCIKCGTKLNDEMVFCPKCGRKVI
ncbi:MAG: zinc ribbon domain-containing protein [Dehalococcoidales bacterium]|jgi:rRNA maturation endonuclease Nob1|nr:zinc ribbon domain-containing protein [Dehalococcoidales bacterium]